MQGLVPEFGKKLGPVVRGSEGDHEGKPCAPTIIELCLWLRVDLCMQTLL